MSRSAPPPQRTPRPIPGRIGAVLKLLDILIAHARYFAATVATRADIPEFASVAAVFGTYDLPMIQIRVRRGILRALALQRYLLARAAKGRNLRFSWPPYVDLQPHHRPPPRPASPCPAPAKRPVNRARPRKDPALLSNDDPDALRDLSLEELEAGVRRRTVGRTITLICLDLGLVPGFCDGAVWMMVYNVLRRYGGSINNLYDVRFEREKTFQRERDRRPDTWDINWRDFRPETVRLVLGCRIGEPLPPDWTMPGPPDWTMSGLPEPVPS